MVVGDLIVVELVDEPDSGELSTVVVVCHPEPSVVITRLAETESPGYPPLNVTV